MKDDLRAIRRAYDSRDPVDYRHLPRHFDRYSPTDQARIANRMVAVLQAARDGVDLESGPLPVGSLPLAEALAKLDLYKLP